MSDSEVSAGAKDTPLTIGGKTFNSRLFTGTGKFASGALLRDAVLASGSEMVTMAVKRLDFQGQHDAIRRLWARTLSRWRSILTCAI